MQGACAALLGRAAAAEPGAGAPALALWPGRPPGGGGPSGPVEVNEAGAWSHVASPALEAFRPAHPNGAAVLVAAGGGYKREQIENEARPAARWLAERGVTAFVLSYRLPGEGWQAGALAPLQDAQRALRMIRARASGEGIDAARIAVLGFSAGGHLLGLAAARSGFRSYEPVDEIDKASARPAAAALIYPVITLQPPYDHTSTRRMLVGDHPSADASAEWSVQTHVGAACPPVFMVQAADDPVSNPANSLLMAEACEHAGVPVERHLLPSGGHGFGMGRAGSPSAHWPAWYEAWLVQRGLMRA